MKPLSHVSVTDATSVLTVTGALAFLALLALLAFAWFTRKATEEEAVEEAEPDPIAPLRVLL